MIPALPSHEYEAKLGQILRACDWQALREFTRKENEVPDEVYAQDRHFWEVLMHKLTCSRIDLIALHDASRTWLAERGYSSDVGGY